MNIDGVNTLACLCRIEKDTKKASKVYPLPHSMLIQAIVLGFSLTSSVHCQGSRARSYTILVS